MDPESDNESQPDYEDYFYDVENNLGLLAEEYAAEEEDLDAEQEGEYKERLIELAGDVIAIVEEVQKDDPEELPSVLEQAEAVLNKMITFAYHEKLSPGKDSKDDSDSEDSEMDGLSLGAVGLFSMMKSFAETTERPLLQISKKRGEYSHNILNNGLELMKMMDIEIPKDKLPKPYPPWKNTLRFHPRSSRCARFLDDCPLEGGPTEDSPRALSVYQARAEVSITESRSPVSFFAPPTGRFLFLLGQSGWKLRTPLLSYWDVNDQPGDYMDGKSKRLSFTGIASHGAADDESGLVFVGDWDRVKSYSWWDTTKNEARRNLFPVHTLKSAGFSGAIGMFPNGRVGRSGPGKIGIWTIADLPTHGASGKDRIGESIGEGNDIDTWRDDPENIERSAGSEPHSTITLSEETYEVSLWRAHPSTPGLMLTTSKSEKPHYNYYCRVVDLEAGGKFAARYLGHGGEVKAFSTSKGDANIFATACDDGYSRLYDVRQPLPVITIESGHNSVRECTGVVLCHPDGIPYMFTSGKGEEAIRLWDIRARAPIYDLATGNNAVVSMVWNEDRNELFAATEWPHSSYAKAYIPIDENGDPEEGEEFEEDPNEITYLYKEKGVRYKNTDQAWPRQARHSETYFGHVFDSGGHRIYRYAFKMEPDRRFIPPDGGAEPDRGGSGSWGW